MWTVYQDTIIIWGPFYESASNENLFSPLAGEALRVNYYCFQSQAFGPSLWVKYESVFSPICISLCMHLQEQVIDLLKKNFLSVVSLKKVT